MLISKWNKEGKIVYSAKYNLDYKLLKLHQILELKW
jgi:hypothetical protein